METLTHMIQGHTNPVGLVFHLMALGLIVLALLGFAIAAIWQHFARPRRTFRVRAAYGRRKASRRNVDSWGF